jgi:phosphatidylglycerol:prolipoprotein diacylglycerol transferase
MHPILFKLGPLTLHTYGVMLATSVLLGTWLASKRARDAGLDGEKVWNLCIYIVLAALLVAKIWLLLADFSFYRQNPREIFSLSTLQSGGVFYGGFLGGLIVAVAGARMWKMPMLKLLDVLAPSLMLGAAIGRIGCFSAGCCYGSPAHVAWAITFTDPYASRMFGTPLGIPLHPAQLYNFAAAALIFVFLLWLTKRKKFDGQTFAAMIALYGATRFATEFYRGDPGRALSFTSALSQAQLTGILLVVIGAVMWWRGSRGRAGDRLPVAGKARAGRNRK